jgi:hypothetical protein
MNGKRCVFRDPNDRCNHAAVNAAVSDADCDRCALYSGPLRGMGDAFHVALSAVGIPAAVRAVSGSDCGGCGARRAAMNRALPFADKVTENHDNGDNL